jgi:murein endopeptidase
MNKTARATRGIPFCLFGLTAFSAAISSFSTISARAADSLNPALSSEFRTEMVVPPGEQLDLDVCEEWNPEFVANGMRCCGELRRYGRRVRHEVRCDAHRNRASYCSEITPEQHEYADAVNDGKISDLMEFLDAQVQHRSIQSFCSVNTGFLIRGRTIVPTKENGVLLRSPGRCTNYGTEPMVAMLEWLGRKVKKQFSEENPGIHLLIGDVSAPRGGCLASSGGRKGHKSHAAGEDADVGFVTPKAKGSSPDFFHNDLQVKPNFWFLQQVFHNPYACIKVIFLDRRQIAKLAKTEWADPDWLMMRKYIHHVRGHRNHFHIRIGDRPGQPGCAAPTDEENDEDSGDESDSG